MTCKIVVEIKAKPDHVDDLLKSFAGMLPITRDYDGCIEVSVYQDQEDPTIILLLHEWETREKFDTYFAWRGEQGDRETLTPWITQPMSLRFFDKKL